MKHSISPGEAIFYFIVRFTLIFAVIITLYPFVYVFSMSISDPIFASQRAVWLFPKGFSTEAYKLVFSNPDIWQAYGNTIWYTVVGTILSVGLTLLTAYPLSRRNFFATRPVMLMIVFTMCFNGGLIPSYILVQNLGLYNTRWAIILPVAISAWNMMVARTFFASIPESLIESARIDGASDLKIFTRIILPLSKPIIAVLILFYAVDRWNSYFSALIYLTDSKLHPLQIYLMKLLIMRTDNHILEGIDGGMGRSLILDQIKYAAIMVVIFPILCVYPFLQKYFVKGVMIGAIKE